MSNALTKNVVVSMIVYELWDKDNDLVYRSFTEIGALREKMSLENRGAGRIRMEKLFLQKDDIEDRYIETLKRYKYREGKWQP